jgi:uncharacterized membrane protein YccC
MIVKLNIMPMQLSLMSQQEIFIFRFFVGMMLAIVLAFGFDWPFAFITPIFVAKFLGAKRAKIPFKALMAVMLVIVAAFILGGIFARLLLPYPIVFMLVITLFIFWVSYWNNSGGNELVITMLLVGFTVIPMLALLHQSVAEQFTIGFLFSCLISVVITMVMFEVIPDKELVKAQQKAEMVLPDKSIRVRFALLSTLMIIPVLAVFLYFKLSSSLLILVFIAILAQKPDFVAGVKGSKALLVGNTLGGLVAITMYNLLLIAPDFIFMLMLFALITIVFAGLIYSERPFAPLYAMAFSTVIILISSATLGSSDAEGTFYTRIVQIACACFYVIFATVLASPWIKKISQM